MSYSKYLRKRNIFLALMERHSTKKAFEEKESFLHKYAKELLRKWIAESWKGVDNSLLCSIEFVDKHKQENITLSGSPDFIFLEYPITTHFPYLIDENQGCIESGFQQCMYRSEEEYCPCFKCSRFDKSKLKYVVDLAIEHEGNIMAVIEVVNKHPTPKEKKEYIRSQIDNDYIPAFEIDARHILGQIKKPKKLYVHTF